MRLTFLSKIGFCRIAIILALFFASRAASADVLKIVVDDTIHPVIAEHIDRAIQEATSTHADALLIELRTPGGLMTSMEAHHPENPGFACPSDYLCHSGRCGRFLRRVFYPGSR